ncbi:MAG: hypothetical protein HY337_07970 [Gemmatimonadetes bacterium]|nr:hypothetical protein [Gemmatimonadota bacterium]
MTLPRASVEARLMWASGPAELLMALSDLVWPAGVPLTWANVNLLYGRWLRMAAGGRLSLRAKR